MNELQKQEIFEIEVLDLLKNASVLNNLIFGGGTMLRLCHDLPRFSVDLDFWTFRVKDFERLHKDLESIVLKYYELTDSVIKYFTILLELRKKGFARKLKIEIRKNNKRYDFEDKIAFSKFSNKQVLVKSFTLKQMVSNKINALLERRQIRDAFDLEFILKKGNRLDIEKDVLLKLKKVILSFKKRDYTVVLGSLLEPDIRSYYNEKNFEYLLLQINEILSS